MTQVLVVDPGELGELLVALLSQYGMPATHVRTGEEALERTLADKPGLVIVEHDLPDAAGIDVAELLRTEVGTKVILTYAQSLLSEPNDELLARLRGIDACFARPFRSLSLVEEAARLVGTKLTHRHPPRNEPDPGVIAPPLEDAAFAGAASYPHPSARPSSMTEKALPQTPLDETALAHSAAAAARRALLSSAEGVLSGLDDPTDELFLDVEVGSFPGVVAPTSDEEDEDEALFAALLISGEEPPPDAAGPAPPLASRIAERTYSPGTLGELWRRVKERRGAAPQDRAPSAREDIPLTPRSLADMLDAFHQSQTTGELWLSLDRAKRVLLLRRGVVVGARSNLEGEDLAALALRRQLLTAEQAELLRADVREGRQRTLADAMVARALVSEEALPALTREQVRRIALGAFQWQSGSLRVTLEGRATQHANPVVVPVADLIMRGILLTEGDDALLAAAPDDARFSPATDSGYGLQDLTLNAEEARAVVAMDGTKTIKDLITLFDPSPSARTIRGLAAGLLCLNLLRFAGWGPAEARRISFF